MGRFQAAATNASSAQYCPSGPMKATVELLSLISVIRRIARAVSPSFPTWILLMIINWHLLVTYLIWTIISYSDCRCRPLQIEVSVPVKDWGRCSLPRRPAGWPRASSDYSYKSLESRWSTALSDPWLNGLLNVTIRIRKPIRIEVNIWWRIHSNNRKTHLRKWGS